MVNVLAPDGTVGKGIRKSFGTKHVFLLPAKITNESMPLLIMDSKSNNGDSSQGFAGGDRGRLRLVSGVRWAVVATIASSLLQWMNFVIIARLGNTDTLGEYALSLSFVAPFVILSGLQLRNMQGCDAHEDFEIGDYFTLRCITGLVSLLMILLIGMTLNNRNLSREVVLLLALARTLDGLSDVFYGCLQKHARLDVVAWSLTMKGAGACLVTAVGVGLLHSVAMGLVMTVGVSLAVLGSYDLPQTASVVRANGGTFSMKQLIVFGRIRSLFRLTYPLGISAGLNSLRSNMSRYIIAHSLGAPMVGIHSALLYFNFGVLTAAASVGQAVGPKFGVYAHQRRMGELRRVVSIVAATAFFCGLTLWCAFCVFGHAILVLAYGTEVGKYSFVLPYTAAALPFALAASFLNDCMIACRSTQQQLRVMICVTTIEVTMAMLLVGEYQLKGIAMAGISAAVLQMALTATHLYERTGVRRHQLVV